MDLDLLRDAQDGDVDARNRIALANYGLVEKFSRQLAGDDEDEFLRNCSDGFVGLLEAIDGFRPEKGFTFSTWAVYRIKGHILSGQRKCLRRRRLHSSVVERALMLESDRAAGVNAPLLVECADDVKKLTSILDSWKRRRDMVRYAAIIELRFGLDPDGPLDYLQIGARFGLSRERIRVMADRAFQWLCNDFGEPPTRKCSGKRTIEVK